MTEPIDIEFPALQGVRHSFVDAGGLRMHVAEAGPKDGEAVILLHGWPQHWYEWRGLVPLMSKDYRMVMPDLRGMGWTEITKDGYDKEQLAFDVVALMDAMGIEKANLMGHDWGGYAGFMLSLFHPERVNAYVAMNIVHPWPQRTVATALNSWRLAYQVPLAAPLLGPRVTRIPGFVKLMLTGFPIGGHPFTEEEVEAFEAPLRDPERAKVTARYYRSFQARDLPKLAMGHYKSMRLKVPTLLLFGTGDAVMIPEQMEGFEDYADDMRLEIVPDTGHFIADAKPDVVAERALEFFAAR